MKSKKIFYSQKRKFENVYLAKELQNISVLETIFIYKSQITIHSLIAVSQNPHDVRTLILV